jgi:excisionase family DNA binding protein
MKRTTRPFLRTGDVTALLGVSRTIAIKWIDEGRLPSIQLPGISERRVQREHLLAFARRQGLPVQGDPYAGRSVLIASPDTRLTQHLAGLLEAEGYKPLTAASVWSAGLIVGNSGRLAAAVIDCHLGNTDAADIAAALANGAGTWSRRCELVIGLVCEDQPPRDAGPFTELLRHPIGADAIVSALKARWPETNGLAPATVL